MNLIAIIKKSLFALCFVTLSAHAAGPASFRLANKSNYEIYCRDRSIMQAQDNVWTGGSNFVLKPGEFREVPGNRDYSIRTAGPKSALSQYYDVPRPYDLAQKSLNPEQFHQFDLTMTRKNPGMAIINITSGWTHGWKFTLSYMH
jgi:hypothetical protein